MTAPPLVVGVALFLDVDGTLLPIAATPEAVEVPSGLPCLLARTARRLHGALALVSGRSVATLDSLFDGAIVPVAGVHGLERRTAQGTMEEASVPHEALVAMRKRLRHFADRHPGVLIEDKRVALAIHYRGAPGLEQACLDEAGALAARHGGLFVLQRGKMVCELRPSGATKADAVAAFLDEEPFRGRRPVFVGDDLTDEDAFRLVNDRGGESVRVGASPGSAACHVLEDVPAVLRWLGAFVPPSTD